VTESVADAVMLLRKGVVPTVLLDGPMIKDASVSFAYMNRELSAEWRQMGRCVLKPTPPIRQMYLNTTYMTVKTSRGSVIAVFSHGSRMILAWGGNAGKLWREANLWI
jgi:hypothetical protein